MSELCVVDISAVVEPGASASTTAVFADLVEGALGTSAATAYRLQIRFGYFCMKYGFIALNKNTLRIIFRHAFVLI